MKKLNSKFLKIFCFTALSVIGIGGCAKEKSALSDSTQTDLENQNQISGELNLFTWDGMFPQEVLDNFEKEYGIKINFANFDYDEEMLAKLETAGGGDYDLVIADDYIIEIAIEEGLVQKLDKSKIGNYGNIDPVFQGQFYDETDEYTIPYGAGIPLIVYDKSAAGIEITGYQDLWNPALENNIALLGNYRVINGMVLKTMGKSFNETDSAVLEEMKEKLFELAPNIRLISDSNTQDYLISGEVSVGFLYTSQVTMALAARPELEVVYPKEGLGFGIMAGFIPSNAPNANAAHAFLNYILQPEIAAKCFAHIGYVCTNKEAVAYLPEEMKKSLALPEEAKNGEFIMDIEADANELHEKIWTEFKSLLN